MSETDLNGENVRHNLEVLVQAIGSLSKLQRATGVPTARISEACRAHAPLAEHQVQAIESQLNLPGGWLTLAHGPDLLQEAREHLSSLGFSAEVDNSAQMQERRRSNIQLLAGPERGAKTALCNRLGWPSTEFSNFMKRVFGAQRARSIERKLGIPSGWLDEEHGALELPNAFEERLSAIGGNQVEYTSAPVSPAKVGRAGATSSISGGPIARALLETLSNLVKTGGLSESNALELLNRLQEMRPER